jgi:hypothetical protein
MTCFTLRSSAAAFLLLGMAAVGPIKAELVAADWTDSSTNASGNYTHTPGATQNGSGVSGAIQTDASQTSPDNEVTNYLRTGSDLGIGFGDTALLGDLSGFNGLTATFNITNNNLAAGAQFTSSEIVGELIPGQTGSPTNSALRLVFTGGAPIDNAGTPNEWWFDGNPAVVTSMLNGVDVTANDPFDPALWSNYNGIIGNSSPDATAQFDAALSDVTRLGLSFGSGDFFSDGFAFNTGGTAAVSLDAISATPEPGTFGLLLAGGAILLGAARRKFSGR